MSGLQPPKILACAPAALSCVPGKSAHGTEYVPLSQPVQRAHAGYGAIRAAGAAHATRRTRLVPLRALDALVWLARAIPLVIPAPALSRAKLRYSA
ncbi:hypothetical protein DFH06DRAFT_1341380 [Mycena polygramma]|nr:hypothetical protein DFH06DRAFT_1341380 [Mycena polygramma]